MSDNARAKTRGKRGEPGEAAGVSEPSGGAAARSGFG